MTGAAGAVATGPALDPAGPAPDPTGLTADLTGLVTDPALIRGLALMVPVAAVLAAAAVRRHSERDAAAAILATAWNLTVLAAVNVLAAGAGWWHFAAEGAVWYGVPADLLLGWALLWGALPALAARRAPLPLVVAALAWFDLAVMPLGRPVVVLGDGWLTGETLAVAAALVPGLLLARWTSAGRRLRARVAMQVLLAAGAGLALPVAATQVWRQPSWALGLLAQALAVPVLLGLAAVREFAESGRGTPLPYDPPERLVRTGPYAYVRNPMQVSMAAAYLLLAPFDRVFLAAAAVALAYGAGLAAWHEGERLGERYGAAWEEYRLAVRPWVPRPRPAVPAGAPDATLHVSRVCGECSRVGDWFVRRRPAGLRILAAEDHPAGLRRIAYTAPGGGTVQGVAAVARALVNVHLGWALLGWALLLPGVTWFAQLCVDAFGGGPRAETLFAGRVPGRGGETR
ncbi:methyltransferase family protein [Streptosporangium sandarakinum]|uniref:methyltransferase family protein n=1 Tax=Streptosporangium sandarakinum TaxID=1260955 RepID=UPI0033B87EC7